MKKDFSLYSYKPGDGHEMNSLPFCKLAICENGEFHIHSCAMIRAKKEIMYADFRETNRSDDIERLTGKKDPAFEEFKKQIEDFVEKCPHWKRVPQSLE